MGEPFTLAMPLCGDDGIVRSGRFFAGTEYPCTGSAHFAGEHIRCTSSAHPFAAEDALPDRPESIADPLPEDLERLLRDPCIAIERDWDVHRLMRDYLSRTPGGRVTRELYLNLWALIDAGEQ